MWHIIKTKSGKYSLEFTGETYSIVDHTGLETTFFPPLSADDLEKLRYELSVALMEHNLFEALNGMNKQMAAELN